MCTLTSVQWGEEEEEVALVSAAVDVPTIH